MTRDMAKDSGVLSIDFLVGFTIFLIAFVWVISMIPGLLIGLQAYTIDYDAVAYRTGVILVEDPGEIVAQNITAPWESLPADQVARLGLAVSRDTPNILSEEKVNRFFCSTVFSYPKDYHDKAIFGDYPYHFNISLHDVDRKVNRSVGDVLPEGYGYIRRIVKIKGASNITINEASIVSNNLKNSDTNVTSHTFSIRINTPALYNEVTDPSYQIDPVKDQIMINITDLNSTMSNTINTINLTSITIAGVPYSSSIPETGISIDGQNSTLPHDINVSGNISITFSPRFFQGVYEGIYDPALYKPVFVNLTFNLGSNSTFLNNSWSSSPFDYNYTTATLPPLRDGVVEVAVW